MDPKNWFGPSMWSLGRARENCWNRPISFSWASQIIDASGKVVAPGLVDIHVHFREPGQTHKEDIHTGALAAAAGGFTTVVMMANTSPTISDVETLQEVLQSAAKEKINVKTVATITKNLMGKIWLTLKHS